MYKYPQAAFPYEDLVVENARRSRHEPEYELLDTGVFDADRYFDVEVEHAKAAPDDLVCRITVHNRGPDDAPIHVLPTLWFRNTWRWDDVGRPPVLWRDGNTIAVDHPRLDGYRLDAAPGPTGDMPGAVFCNNETNTERLYGVENTSPYPKDGINDHVVAGAATVDPDERGTKAAWWYHLDVGAGDTAELRLRLHRPEDSTTQPAPRWRK